MIKGYGFMETDKATMTGLNSLEQVVKDEISSAGEDAGPATPGPTTGTPIIPLPGGTAPAPGASPEISDEARRRYDAIFGPD